MRSTSTTSITIDGSDKERVMTTERKPTHPGEVLLEDVLRPLGVSITDGAKIARCNAEGPLGARKWPGWVESYDGPSDREGDQHFAGKLVQDAGESRPLGGAEKRTTQRNQIPETASNSSTLVATLVATPSPARRRLAPV